MAATWSIVNLDRQISLNGKTDVVTTVHWQAIDSEIVGSGDDQATHTGRAFGSVRLDTSDLSSFKDYADLTEADAIAWAKADLGEDQVAAYEKRIADQITESKTPTTGIGVPW